MERFSRLMVALLMLLPACHRPAQTDSVALRVPGDSTALYFPAKPSDTMRVNNAFDTSTDRGYSWMLYRMREPILYNITGPVEVIRFTWLRTFDPPLVIRVTRTGDSCSVRTKVCSGMAGYDPGHLITDSISYITVQEFARFQRQLKAIGFWNLPTDRRYTGFDGAEWILEVKMNSAYHVVTEWTPDNDAFAKACLQLVKWSGLTIPADRIY